MTLTGWPVINPCQHELVVKRKTQQQNTHKRRLDPAVPHTTDSAASAVQRRAQRHLAATPPTALSTRAPPSPSDVTDTAGSLLA